MALLLLRQATVPTAAEMDRDQPLDPEAAARVHAYALYTLRLAGELTDTEERAELYSEAARLLLRLGETDSAAAALRTVLECRPLDAAALSALHPLLTRRAEETGDPGPLLELLNFRLALPSNESGDEIMQRSEQALRVTLLAQRAGLSRQCGQDVAAEGDLTALLKLEPEHALAHRWLAELRGQYGDTEAAIYHYERFLALDAKPAERQAAHAAVARLLAQAAPARAAFHVQKAIEFGQRYRALRGSEVDTLEEVHAQGEQYRWLSALQLQLGQRTEAAATLRELLDRLPSASAFSGERQQVSLELAEILEKHTQNPAAALAVVEQVLKEVPLALPALERLIELARSTGELARPPAVFGRARFPRSSGESAPGHLSSERDA
jgi:tetratricopeptide (TPR) repeat protein